MLNRITRISRRVHAPIHARSFAIIASDSERMLRDTLSLYAKSVIQPKVSEMDEKGVMDPSIVKSLFEQVCHRSCDHRSAVVGIYGD